MEDYHTIQTADHGSVMLAEMHVLQKQGVMCDVILAAEDGEVMAHKVVLMAASKFFREKLSPVVSQSAAKICLKGISVVELASLVKYIYTGKLLVAKDTMDITLEISEILELNGVIQGYNEIVSNEAALGQYASKGFGEGQTRPGVPVSNEKNSAINHDLKIPLMVQKHVKVEAESPNESPTVSKEANACEYGFQLQNPYHEQYVDVSVGSRSPSEAVPTASSVKIVNHLEGVDQGVKSAQISEEESQHQDLLAVAIESLSDTSSMMSHQRKAGAEQEAGVGVDKQFKHSENRAADIDDRTLNVTSFVNGRTNTKTVTLNAGIVNNEYGGHTEVYTVSLDPSSLKAPIQMPRPMRKRTDKEKKAREIANKYRRKKNEVLNTNLPEQLTEQSQVSECTKGINPSSDGTHSGFQYASLSKERKKTNNMPLIDVPVNLIVSEKDSISDGEKSLNLNSQPSNDGYYQIVMNSDEIEDTVEVHTDPMEVTPTKLTENESKEGSGSAKTLKHVTLDSPKTPSTDEDNRSSATKRKTRTPKRLPWSEGEVVNESDVRASIPVVRTRKNSKLDSKPQSTDKMQQDYAKQSMENVPDYMLPHVRLERHYDSTAVTYQKQTLTISTAKCDGTVEMEPSEECYLDEDEESMSMVQDVDLSGRGRKRKSVVKPEFEYSLKLSVKKKREIRNSGQSNSHQNRCDLTNDSDTAVDKGTGENKDATEKEIANKSDEVNIDQSSCSRTKEALVENVMNSTGHPVEAACNTEDTHAELDDDKGDPDTIDSSFSEETDRTYSLATQQNMKLADTSQRMLNCQHCGYQTPLSGNLRKHMQGVHKLVVVHKELQQQPKFSSFRIGQVVTVDGQLFDSKTMTPPASRRVHPKPDTDCKPRKEFDGRKRFSLKNLPVEEFTKEILRRHHAYVNAPEKTFNFMTPVLAKSTLLPSFPQASPNVRNSNANKLYNMPKISPKYTPLNQSAQGWVPLVVKEVEVTQQRAGYEDIVIENVESGVPYRTGSTVLKLVERRNPADNEQMIMITSNGVQSIVRSQDFYQTLLESGQESSETLKVISSLLEAGEEIEIREEGETVEIQNI
ncbi:uncharacterized protein LOC127865169 [Dreissena polymorpha]|uniref:BTB domain-containing protein n=1 Tax=Dreissena polymorpha TaxID=45954 RepID=A0A9D4N3L0_DREPO|nr:uncharacterized protein LOC127865169 [Dreissena polymorpha]KAH3887243.1 hypothetical protein DPMN_011259 [Dreissena polymorpha]